MKKLIIIVLVTSLVGFWACESTAVEPQVNETDILLSKIQNASLDEIHQFFGTTNSEGISIRKEASYLKLVFPNKSLNTDDLIIIVEDEYLDNIEEAPRALFVNTQTFEVETGLITRFIDGEAWSLYITQNESIGSHLNLDSRLFSFCLGESSEKGWLGCVDSCAMEIFYDEWQSYLEKSFVQQVFWWVGLPDLYLETMIHCGIECL